MWNTSIADIRKRPLMRTILALILREMGSTYGRSPGGYIWAILQPIGMILVLAFGFSLLLRSPSLGTSFILFYATGYLPYDLYNTLTTKMLNAIKYSRPLMAYPKVVWIDAFIARFTLNTLTYLTVSAIVMSGILYWSQNRAVLDVEYIMLGFGMCALLGAGAGMVNCLLVGLFPVWKLIWQIITRPMFIASGVFFVYEDMPVAAQNFLWWNPVLHGTGLVRKGFYPTYNGSYISLEYGFGFALVLICAGLLFMSSYYKVVLER